MIILMPFIVIFVLLTCFCVYKEWEIMKSNQIINKINKASFDSEKILVYREKKLNKNTDIKFNLQKIKSIIDKKDSVFYLDTKLERYISILNVKKSISILFDNDEDSLLKLYNKEFEGKISHYYKNKVRKVIVKKLKGNIIYELKIFYENKNSMYEYKLIPNNKSIIRSFSIEGIISSSATVSLDDIDICYWLEYRKHLVPIDLALLHFGLGSDNINKIIEMKNCEEETEELVKNFYPSDEKNKINSKITYNWKGLFELIPNILFISFFVGILFLFSLAFS